MSHAGHRVVHHEPAMHHVEGRTFDHCGRQISPSCGIYRKPQPISISTHRGFIGVLVHGLTILKSVDISIY
jgi:hypothetical protein